MAAELRAKNEEGGGGWREKGGAFVKTPRARKIPFSETKASNRRDKRENNNNKKKINADRPEMSTTAGFSFFSFFWGNIFFLVMPRDEEERDFFR